MERALETVVVLDFALNGDVCSHVRTVCLEGIEHFVLPSEQGNILSPLINIHHLPWADITRGPNDEPPIGISGQRSGDPLLLVIIISFKINFVILEFPVVEKDQSQYKHDEPISQGKVSGDV